MTRYRFIHAADLHLDTPFEGLGRTAPHVAEALRDASLEVWDALVQLAIDRDAAFLLLAGDLYDGPQHGVRAQLRFVRGLEALAARRIDTFVVYGNHDPLDGWSAIRRWPPGVVVFGGDQVQRVKVERSGERLATIHGISYARRDVIENLAHRFARTADAGLHIGLLHCNVGGREGHAQYSPCTVDDLRRAGMHYWALGHVHRHEVVSARDPLIVYSGSTQGRSLHVAEQGPKGAVVVEAAGEDVRIAEFVALDRVRFLTVPVDVSALPDLPALHQTLAQLPAALRSGQEGRALVLKPVLQGRGVLYADLRVPGATSDLMRELRREAEGLEPLVWWESPRDLSAPPLDRAAIAERGDVSSELLQRIDALLASEGDLARVLEPQLEVLRKIGAARWLRHDDGRPEEPAASLLRDAEAIALDTLERDR